MANKLTPQQEEYAKSFIYDVLYGAHILDQTKPPMWKSRPYFQLAAYTNQSMIFEWRNYDKLFTQLGEAIIDAKLTPSACNTIISGLDAMSQVGFWLKGSGKPHTDKVVRKKQDMLMLYIAWFSAQAQIVWDDVLLSQSELENVKNTIIYGPLATYRVLASQQNAGNATTNTTAAKSSTRIPGQPTNNYKSLGPLSDRVPTLVSTPGQKEILQTTVVFSLEADKIGANTPCCYVTPIDQHGVPYAANKAATVKFGSGNGYSDCRMWTDDTSTALAWEAACKARFGSTYKNIHVVQTKVDKKGYYKVRTELGDCYINPKKLNEKLVDEELESEPTELIHDIDVYEEWARASIS